MVRGSESTKLAGYPSSTPSLSTTNTGKEKPWVDKRHIPLPQKVVLTSRTSTPSRSTSNSVRRVEGYDKDCRNDIGNDEELRILVELVGATNLEPADFSRCTTRVDGKSSLVSGSFSAFDGCYMASPFCRVFFGDDEVDASGQRITRVLHRTATISNCNNPIWDCDSGSLFLLSTTPDELLRQKKGLRIEVLDQFPFLRQSMPIGNVCIDAATMLDNCRTGERVEFNLDSRGEEEIWDSINSKTPTEGEMQSSTNDNDGEKDGISLSLSRSLSWVSAYAADEDDFRPEKSKMALRFRLATDSDVQFLRSLKPPTSPSKWKAQKETLDIGVEGRDERDCRPTAEIVTEKEEGIKESVLELVKTCAFKLRGTYTDKSGLKRYRVKPGPDPANQNETKYMTKVEMGVAVFNKSTNWVEAGSGSLGRVYLEILRCSGLTNMDKSKGGSAIGNKTDSFVCAVYEDCLVETDVIDDSLSPLWMPWTQRAFAFNRMHPLSTLHIGVFDYEMGPFNHQGIGRIGISLGEFAPDATHLLTYDLHSSSNITERKSKGRITIRLRIETDDARGLLLAAAIPPPSIYVNVKKDKTLHVAKYTCYGKYRSGTYNSKLLKSYVAEVVEYATTAVTIIGDAVESLVLWRGQVFHLPIYSAVAFMLSAYIADRPHLLPSFFFLFLAGLMLACMTACRRHPSPWHRCSSFHQYLRKLLTGHSSAAYKDIEPFEGAREAAALERAWTKRLEDDRKSHEKIQALKDDVQKAIAAVGDDSIENETSINPLAAVQKICAEICKVLRCVKMVVCWEEGMLSFWVTFCLLAIGVVLTVIPWGLLIRVTSKALVYIVLGPQNKLVDIFLIRRGIHFGWIKEKSIKRKERELWRSARLRREEAVKLKATRVRRYGQFIMKVPCLNIARYVDTPRPESVSKRNNPKSKRRSLWWHHAQKVVPGQTLYGAMIHSSQQKALSRKAKKWLKQLHKVVKDCHEMALKAEQMRSLAGGTDDSLRNGHNMHESQGERELETREPELISRHYEFVSCDCQRDLELDEQGIEIVAVERALSDDQDHCRKDCTDATFPNNAEVTATLAATQTATSPGVSATDPTPVMSGNRKRYNHADEKMEASPPTSSLPLARSSESAVDINCSRPRGLWVREVPPSGRRDDGSGICGFHRQPSRPLQRLPSTGELPMCPPSPPTLNHVTSQQSQLDGGIDQEGDEMHDSWYYYE